MSASEVAAWTEKIVEHVPKHSILQVLFMARLVEPSEGDSGACPKCGRALPVFSFPPAYSGPRSFGRASYTDYEWTLRCLVDGVERMRGRDIALPVLFDATAQIADAMLRQGWPEDARRLRDALQTSDEGRRAERVGQELLCERDRLLRKAGDAPLALAASLARYWPTSPPKS
jgi:hypothetical protein